MQELREEFMWLQTFEFFQMLPNFVNSVMAVLQPQTILSGIMYHPSIEHILFSFAIPKTSRSTDIYSTSNLKSIRIRQEAQQ